MLCTAVLYLQRLQNRTKELNIASGARRVGGDFDIKFAVSKIDSVLLLESSSEHGGVIPAQEERHNIAFSALADFSSYIFDLFC